MIDTHCHVQDPKFAEDRDEVITRARAAGVTEMVTISENLEESPATIETARRYGIRAAVGIHPHEAAKAPADLQERLQALLREPEVVAVGEIGLDYYYDNSPRDVQARVMRAQLAVAREAGMPVVFHQRDAFDDFTAILRDEWKPQMRGVVHCFTGNADQARAFVDEFGLYLGIGGVLTFPKAEELREAVRAVGIAPIVLETDCPYLAPVPVRGKRNEPAFVTHVAKALEGVLGASAEEIAAATDANAHALFGLSAQRKAR